MRWPLPTEPQTTILPGARFAATRPWGAAKPTRRHVGVDLAASEGTAVLAPEAGVVTDVDRGWDGTAKGLVLAADSGRTWLFGGVAAGQSIPKGSRVEAGAMIAQVGYYTKTNGAKSSMLHVTLFAEPLSPVQVSQRQRWWIVDPPPPGLVDPWPFLAAAEGPEEPMAPGPPPAGLYVETAGGVYSSERPCLQVGGVLSCGAEQAAAWSAALIGYVQRAADEYERRGLATAPGDPAVERGREWLGLAALVLQGDLQAPQLGSDVRVSTLVNACQQAEMARRAFADYGGEPFLDEPARPPASSSGAGVAIGVTAALLVLGVAMAMRGRR